jgi:Protein of unknown function (DUF2752)
VPVGRGRGVRWAPYAVLVAVAAAAAYVAAVDPDRPGHYPTCPFLAVTGYYCPGCGTLRMVHALTHGHVGEAFGRNALAFLTLPAVAYLWVRWTVAARRGRPLQATILRPWAIIAFAVVIVVFWVLRNLPAGHALAP